MQDKQDIGGEEQEGNLIELKEQIKDTKQQDEVDNVDKAKTGHHMKLRPKKKKKLFLN